VNDRTSRTLIAQVCAVRILVFTIAGLKDEGCIDLIRFENNSW
jgi:hypothetical protein